jgi:hypothetical protein
MRSNRIFLFPQVTKLSVGPNLRLCFIIRGIKPFPKPNILWNLFAIYARPLIAELNLFAAGMRPHSFTEKDLILLFVVGASFSIPADTARLIWLEVAGWIIVGHIVNPVIIEVSQTFWRIL